ncbi:CoA ester lyase [Mesorhizobium sp. J428]|uniref:HpcH/HpaI aldolase/citrate lyase family protein n=1 Tax=Mesorhizobium sp. J428 TaxID=2898440 RepID=UPI002151D133|nr:CoA ester lyase [Mesorhizobium sp. J428]MCR5857186.1 CoA ester lyase [Mesorhizobium sp. J428]
MTTRPFRPRRSVLYVPASNAKALSKLPGLACDAAIIDLEDAVAPDAKLSAREALKTFFAERSKTPQSGGPGEIVIRINGLSTEWGPDDLIAARECRPDAILLPKVETPRDILEANDTLDDEDAHPGMWLWAMIETPKALLNIGAIAELGRDPGARLACFVAGTNDLVKETGVRVTPDRRHLVPWLMQMVLAARAGGIDVLDGVANNFRDLDTFRRECEDGAGMGFDGKTLIHPDQIGPANEVFSPSTDEIAQARAIVAAFAAPENAGKGVLTVDGRMTERLHLAQAEKLLARAGNL